MKGRYSGRSMNIYGSILPGAASIARLAQSSKLSKRGKQRLKWMDWYFSHKKNARATCRHFGISPDTFYTWLNRYDPYYLPSLEDRSKRPKHFRESKVPWQVIELLRILRTHFPTWSEKKWEPLFKNVPKLRLLIDFIEDETDKNKAQELINVLSPEALAVSHSTLGRIIKKKGFFFAKSKSKTSSSKNSSIERLRADRALRNQAPGSLIQIDTKHLNTPYGRKYFQFTAIDCKTRIKYAHCYSSCSSRSAKLFLEKAIEYFPFPVLNIQTDNGSEYLKHFHKALKEIKGEQIPHYFSHPHCPKDNCFVERVIQTDKYEFYLNGNLYHYLKLQNEKLDKWNHIYNHIRPHEALNNLSPMEYYERIKHQFQKQQEPKLQLNQIPIIILNREPQKVYGML